ncbi:MAG: hypothetical protein ACT4ON_04615 [Bacteroidota bacterium]
MKKIIYIFILFTIFGFTKKSERITPAFEPTSYTEINKDLKFLNKNSTCFNTDSSTKPNKPTKAKKRKKAKGTQPALYVANEHSTKIHVAENDFALFSKESYFFQLFFSDKKRGPPALSI